MTHQVAYSPAEFCDLFGISKSTLFRWEKEGKLPPVERDVQTGQRKYTQAHVQAVRNLMLRKLYKRAARLDNEAGLMQVSEILSLSKFLAGDLLGLRELAEYSQLSPRTIQHLAQTALEQYQPTDPEFSEIMQVVSEQSEKLSRKAGQRVEIM